MLGHRESAQFIEDMREVAYGDYYYPRHTREGRLWYDDRRLAHAYAGALGVTGGPRVDDVSGEGLVEVDWPTGRVQWYGRGTGYVNAEVSYSWSRAGGHELARLMVRGAVTGDYEAALKYARGEAASAAGCDVDELP